MSYCRFAEDCDVYVYETSDEVICAGCGSFWKWNDLIEHLRQHEKEGDKVPAEVYLRLTQQRDRVIGEKNE